MIMYFGYMMEKKVEAEEVTTFLKLPVYTREGRYIGHVCNIFIDLDEKKISSLLVTNTNPSIVEGTVDVAIPYRWVNAVDDIIILSYFPNKVSTGQDEPETFDDNESDIDVID
jgi:sporulation protein YlmC with PRC-barrel domain